MSKNILKQDFFPLNVFLNSIKKEGHVDRIILSHSKEVYSLAVLPDQSIASSGDYDSPSIKLWNSSNGALINTLQPPSTKKIVSLAVLNDGRLASGDKYYLFIWNVTNNGAFDVKIIDKDFLSLCVINNELIASGSSDNVKVWNIGTGKMVKSLKVASTEWSTRPLLLLDGNRLVGGSGNDLIVWNTTDWSQIAIMKSKINDLKSKST